MKSIFYSIIKSIFYSYYSNKLLSIDDKELIKKIAKTLNKKLLKENFILFITDLIHKLDKSIISFINTNNNYYFIEKFEKTIPDYLIIYFDEKYIRIINESPAIEKKFNISNKIIRNSIDELIFNNYKYILDSYITDDNNYYITKNNKLNIKHTKNAKLLIFVLNDSKKNKTTNSDNSIISSNANNNDVIKYIKKIKLIIKKKQDLIKTIKDKKEINKIKLEIKQYNNILATVKNKLTKKDYIILIKKKYPYYTYLDKYSLADLKLIYERKCNNIDIYYDGNNSCYIDSLIVALFNKQNNIIENIIFHSDIKNYNNDKLSYYANLIKNELMKLYENISLQEKKSSIHKCTNLRKLFQNYITIYRKDVNSKYDNIEWTKSQNDYTDILIFLQVIFNIPDTLKYKRNNIIENRYFLDIFPLDLFIDAGDILYIKDYYPKYSSSFEYFDDYNKKHVYTNKIEYMSSPLLFIQFNRIFDNEKLDTIIVPALKLKLKENKFPLYLNAILIQKYGNMNFGHYICLYECNNIWYEFDDMNEKNIKIGTFDKIIDNENYTRNITGLYYI